MDYEKKYKEALERAREQYNYPTMSSCYGLLEEIFPELKESEGERIRKEIISYLSNELHNIKQMAPRTNQFEDWIAWIKKQDPKKHEEELDAAYKTVDKVQYHRGYEAAWKEMGEQKPPMQNGITINGVEYELIEDREDDECERCALFEECHHSLGLICELSFGDLSKSHRFERRKNF